MRPRLFVLGGRRSGKSRYALARARELGGDAVAFIATARPGDPELDARIAAHRAERPTAWTTLDAGLDLALAVAQVSPDDVVLVDSLTLWAAAVVESDGTVRARWTAAEEVLGARAGHTVIVSEEAGMGVVPMNALTRSYLDELGWLNQRVAAAAREVRLLIAGIPVLLKGDV
jgi:adenosylcobinamide kinase/adenosylcobinamide-phosphate guanylyltransferase